MMVHLGEDEVVWARDVIAVIGVKAARGRVMRKLLMGLREQGKLTTIGEQTNGYVFTARRQRGESRVYATGLSPRSFVRRLGRL